MTLYVDLTIYMAADNDLSEDALLNIAQMEQGYVETGANLLVFIDLAEELPMLLKIEQGKSIVVKNYPEINSADAEQQNAVLSDIVKLYPADGYGLVLWSHGTSWLPAGAKLRAFGDDNGKQMNISDLSAALPVYFDFILFDACLMGAVEVAYELKDNTGYIVAASTETLTDGFPYSEIIPELLVYNVDLKKIAKMYFDHYDNLYGVYRSATISLINTSELEQLAWEMKNLIESADSDFSDFDRTSVQRLDVYSEQYHFDLLDFVETAFPEANKGSFTAQLNKVVEYKAHTPEFIGIYVFDTYCGLSCYVPHPNRTDLNDYYNALKWNQDCELNKLFCFQ